MVWTQMNPSRPFILCVTDLSPRANEAATVAAKLAVRRGEELRLMHVPEPDRPGVGGAPHAALEVEARRLRKEGGEVNAAFVKGVQPMTAVLDYICSERPSLAVVASTGAGDVDRRSDESFSEKIAETSPVPTLLVRNAAAFETWDWTRERLKVLLAVDHYATSDVVLRWAKQFCRIGPCDFVACYVNFHLPSLGDATTSSPGLLANRTEVQHQLEVDLRKRISDQIGEDACPVVVRPFFGEPAPCIAKIADEVRAGLIAVGTHQRRGLFRLAHPSVSRDLMHQTATNVICVPVATWFDPREAHVPAIRRVLVATDFSELGNAAVPYACSVCGAGGSVKILHVAPPSKSSQPEANGAALRERLRALVPNEACFRGATSEVDVVEDHDVAGAICREAQRFGADVVCLSSHGVGLSRAFQGSVATKVLSMIRRPVMIIRRPEE